MWEETSRYQTEAGVYGVIMDSFSEGNESIKYVSPSCLMLSEKDVKYPAMS